MRPPVSLLALSLAVCFVVGCGEKKNGASGTTAATSASAPGKPPVAAKSRAVLPKGPCETDADCQIYLDACDCSCPAALSKLPPTAFTGWNECTDGGAGRNCGAANPCMNLRGMCDLTSKTCANKREK